MDPEDARKIVKGVEFIRSIRGSYEIKHLESEAASRQNARRSLVSNIDIKAGEVITKEMLTFKRPGTGISPTEIDTLIGKTAKVDIQEDTILQYDMFE
jgi:N-acetylneuraminate synthase